MLPKCKSTGSNIVIVAEVLARGLNRLFEDPKFNGFGLPMWTIEMNHLSYAGDIILFSSGHPYSVKKMMNVLRNYERVSRQMINLEKSLLYLYEKAPNQIVNRIKRITGIK